MYAKLTDGKIEEFKGKFLKYTLEKDGIQYFVSVSNPGEKELNEAGYFEVIPPAEGLEAEGDTMYVLSGNTIVAVKDKDDEEASVQ